MAEVDVRALLSDPANPYTANVTTDQINALSAELLERDGGGTMYFAAGDYCIQSIPQAQWNPADRTESPPYVTFATQQGGIILRPGVSYVGEAGTRLVWCDGVPTDPEAHQGPACFMGGWAPFVWVPTSGADGYLVEAVIDEDVAAGDTTFHVEDRSGFVRGTEVVIRLTGFPYGDPTRDQAEVVWWTFATVTEPVEPVVGPGEVTLDRPAQYPMDVGDQAVTGTHVIRKLAPNGRIDNIEIRNFEMVVSDLPQTGSPEGGVVLQYARNCRLSNLVSTDVGAGIVTAHYCQDVHLDNLFVKSASIPDVWRTSLPAYNGHDYYGRGLILQSVHGATVSNLRVEHFETDPVFVEQHSLQCRLKNVYLVNNHPTRRQTTIGPPASNPGVGVQQGFGMVTSIQVSDVAIDGLTVEGVGGFDLFKIDGGRRRVSINDLTLRPVDGDPDYFVPFGYAAPFGWADTLAYSQSNLLRGGVRYDRVLGDGGDQRVYHHGTPRTWSQAAAIPVGGVLDVTLPDGLIRRGRMYVTAKPANTRFDFVNGDTAHQLNLFTSLIAGATVDLPADVTSMGSLALQQVDDVSGAPLRRYLSVDTRLASVEPGEYLVIELEYFPYVWPTAEASQVDHDGGYVQGRDSLRAENVLVGDDTSAELDTDAAAWQDVTFKVGAGADQPWEVSVAAKSGDVVLFTPNFAVGGDGDTSVYFNPGFVRAMSVQRWSTSEGGYPAWIARAASATFTRPVTGGVTARVTDADVVGGRVTVGLQYRLSTPNRFREVVVDDDWAARIELVNLGCP